MCIRDRLRIGKLGDTEYNIRWIPLGGFVKIAGMEADEEPLILAADKVKNLASDRSNTEDTKMCIRDRYGHGSVPDRLVGHWSSCAASGS